jgi:hypothetical protein
MHPRFLHLGTSWGGVFSFMTRPLYPQGKSPRYPIERRLGGLQNRGEETIFNPTGTQTPTPLVVLPAVSRYTDCLIPTALFRLP